MKPLLVSHSQQCQISIFFNIKFHATHGSTVKSFDLKSIIAMWEVSFLKIEFSYKLQVHRMVCFNAVEDKDILLLFHTIFFY